MSAAAIQRVLTELESLPDSEQELVLSFLQALKRRHSTTPVSVARQGQNPALELIDGILVFSGELEEPHTDWLKVVREEREDALIRQALDQNAPR